MSSSSYFTRLTIYACLCHSLHVILAHFPLSTSCTVLMLLSAYHFSLLCYVSSLHRPHVTLLTSSSSDHPPHIILITLPSSDHLPHVIIALPFSCHPPLSPSSHHPPHVIIALSSSCHPALSPSSCHPSHVTLFTTPSNDPPSTASSHIFLVSVHILWHIRYVLSCYLYFIISF